MKRFRLKLSTKFVLFSIVSFTIAFVSIAIYFYIYIQDEEQLKVRNNTIELFSNITQDIQDIQHNLVKQTGFLDSEESILASIYFINTYEYSQDYDKALIDEEKKSIVEALHKRAKFAFNDTILLYVQDQTMAVGVERTQEGYRKFFSSYSKDKKLYYASNPKSNHYTLNTTLAQQYATLHQEFYDNTINAKPQITLHRSDNGFTITAHHSIFEDKKIVAHIEISKRFDTQLLKSYTSHDDTLKFSLDPSLEAIAVDMSALNRVKIVDQQQHYISVLKIPTYEGNIFLKVVQPKIDLAEIIKSGSNSFLTMLAIIAFLFIVIMYAFYHLALIQPLGKLMENIQHINNRDFTHLNQLHCGDELEEIAHNIDHLAHNIEAKEKELQDIAEHDSLTGLYNRYHFNQIINEKMQTVQEGDALALIFIDVDEFKAINDTLGHNIGDNLLVEVANRLNQFVLDHHGYLARIGGDEFMIILPHITHQNILDVFATALHHLFEQAFIINNRYLKITISSGIVLSNDAQKNITALYKEADIALYKSKESGRNRFTIYDENFALEISQRNTILNALKSAQSHHFDEFYLVYQPKILTQDGVTLTGVEALIRWQSSELGLIPPDKFIEIAEESGVIIELGYWIIKQACHDFLALLHEGIDLKQMSINISAIQFNAHNFLETITTLIDEVGIDPASIEFELTERTFAQDDETMLFILNTLRKLGIHIAIDDFGTGYSSLSYLQTLPVDHLKIDKSFVSDIDKRDSIDIVQQAIIPLAHAFGLLTTAEGVERVEEYEILKNIGVDDIQGYYFAKPLKINELKEFVLAQMNKNKSIK